MASCDFCAYNEYDEEDEAYYCSVNIGDEYKVVRHQM